MLEVHLKIAHIKEMESESEFSHRIGSLLPGRMLNTSHSAPPPNEGCGMEEEDDEDEEYVGMRSERSSMSEIR